MAAISHDDLSVCVDCIMLIANGEATDEHAAAVAARWPGMNTLVLTCSDEDCENFSSAPCDGCGSTLAGARCPAVAFA